MSVELCGLYKKYKDVVAVDNINLTINDGELFALLGMNGAGKSTTINMLSCICRPDAGDALIMGKSILKNPNEVKHIINISPQETAIAQNLTVKENLELISKIYASGGNMQDIINSFHLNEVLNKAAGKLSGGYQRRLSIAMALITSPKVLFLDEPTLGLDVIARRELWQYITRLKGKMTIILTTHYLEEAEALANRIAIMNKGQIAALGTPQELIDKSGAANFEDAFIKLSTEVRL